MSKSDISYQQTLLELLASRYDKKSTKSEEYAKQLDDIHEEFIKRNQKLTSLLNDFISQRRDRVKTNKFFKKFIFWFFVGLLALLTIAVTVFFVNNKSSNSIPSMVSLLSVSATYLASLIAVFEIMFKYLFPTDEEKDTISMIRTVIENDVQVEELLSNTKNKSQNDYIEHLKNLNMLKIEQVITQEEFDDCKKNILKKIISQ